METLCVGGFSRQWTLYIFLKTLKWLVLCQTLLQTLIILRAIRIRILFIAKRVFTSKEFAVVYGAVRTDIRGKI